MSEKLDKILLRKILEEQRKEILESLKYREEAARPVELDQSRLGRLSRMDAIQQQAMAQASLRQAQTELLRIDTTLERLESEDYGYCIKCGEDIEWERLKANPSLVVCVGCMQSKE